MKFISYATPNYFEAQKNLTLEARQNGFTDITEYSPVDMDQYFVKENLEILSHPRGAGSALWKPYFILKNLTPPLPYISNEPVLYMDCGDRIKSPRFKDYIESKVNEDGYFIVKGKHPHGLNTRMDCFSLMGCMTDEYIYTTQLEAGICAFTSKFQWFVYEWFDWCRVTEVVMDVPNKNLFSYANLDGFIAHRCDQSILTNLSIKHKLKTTPIDEVVNYVDYNYRG